MSHPVTIEWMILLFLGALQTPVTSSDSPAPAEAECGASQQVRSEGLPDQQSADGEDVLRPPGGGQYRLSAVPFNAVTFEDRFWAPRLETNRKVTLRHNLEQLEKQGSLTGFAILAGDKSQKYRGWMWGDSDVYKTLEGMAYCLRTDADPQREERLNQLVDMVVAAQAPDGYLAPHLQLAEPGYRHFADETTRTSESYNLGHLIESAVAHSEATGRASSSRQRSSVPICWLAFRAKANSSRWPGTARSN